MVALKTWKEGETKGVRLQNSSMSLKLQGYTRQLFVSMLFICWEEISWINTRLSHSVLQVEDFEKPGRWLVCAY